MRGRTHSEKERWVDLYVRICIILHFEHKQPVHQLQLLLRTIFILVRSIYVILHDIYDVHDLLFTEKLALDDWGKKLIVVMDHTVVKCKVGWETEGVFQSTERVCYSGHGVERKWGMVAQERESDGSGLCCGGTRNICENINY